MLVLVTMFISVSSNLPTTAYIKMIDIWMIFSLSIPFIEVLLHTYMDSLREDSDREINHHGKSIDVAPVESKRDVNLISRHEDVQVKALREMYQKQRDSLSQLKMKKLRRVKKFAHIGIPSLAVVFIIFYWYVGWNASTGGYDTNE